MDFILNCFAKTETGAAAVEAGAPPPPPPPKAPPRLTYEMLLKQDASTSAAVIRMLEENETFVDFAEGEAEDIIARDDEDAEKLQAGIQISIDKGVLPALETRPNYMEIDVIGKTPEMISSIIIKDLGKAAKEGGVLVLCGLSGTGGVSKSE